MIYKISEEQAFLAVANYGNFLKAARRLGITRQTLRNRIHGLEEKLETKLFTYHPRGVYLTHSGESHYSHILKRSGRKLLPNEKPQTQFESLKIGASSGISELFSRYIVDLMKNIPNVNIGLISTPDMFNLSLAEFDIVISPKRHKGPNIVSHHLYDSRTRIMASKKYFESNERPKVLEDLKDHTLLVYVFNKNEVSWFNNHWREDERSAPVVMLNNGPNLREAIKSGAGIGIYNYSADFPETDEFEDIFPKMEDYVVPYYICYSKRLEGSPSIEALLTFMKKVVQNWGAPETEDSW